MPLRLALLPLVLVALVAAGCGASEHERVEDALLEFSHENVDPDLGRADSTACREYGGERFRGQQVFYCEVIGARAIADVCVARLGDELYFATGRADCLESGFTHVTD